MESHRGNIWDYVGKARAILITTNMELRRNGHGIMGAGVAKQARDRYPGIEERLGVLVAKNKLIGVLDQDRGTYILSFPTKVYWSAQSSLPLIERSISELTNILDNAKTIIPKHGITMPRPGCGLGGLSWEQVYPLMKHLDDRVLVLY